MNEATSNEMIERLKEHVDLHQVCYEVWPEVLMVAGERVKVGFNLELFGTHSDGESRLSPGCRKCVRTYEDLQQIAEWIMPDEERLLVTRSSRSTGDCMKRRSENTVPRSS